MSDPAAAPAQTPLRVVTYRLADAWGLINAHTQLLVAVDASADGPARYGLPADAEIIGHADVVFDEETGA